MNIYEMNVDDLPPALRRKITIVENAEALHRRVAREFGDLLEKAQREDRLLTMIAPVGPLDYRMFAEEVIQRNLNCRHLRSINMDEYLDEDDQFVQVSHPLSFHKFMNETFWLLLPKDKRPLSENIIYPDPNAPHKVTELIDSIGGADVCWGGFGITGHVAFNDPPSMTGDPTDLASFRNCKARKLTIPPMSLAQMAMGGTNGYTELIPLRAVSLGMYELLKTKYYHMTFMRNWHAGLWRRAMLGPVTAEFPGSLLQEHPNTTITMTRLAAAVPMVNTSQATGETATT